MMIAVGTGADGDGGAGTAMGSVDVAADLVPVVRATLEDLRRRVGMDAWWLTRRRGDELVVLASVGPDGQQPPAWARPWEGTVCAAVLAGRGPRAAPRLADVPAYAHVVDDLGVSPGSVLSVPVPATSGAVLGTLCAFAARERPDLEEHLPTVEVQARLLGALLEHELHRAAHQRGVEVVERAGHLDAGSGLLGAQGWAAALDAEQRRADALALPVTVVALSLAVDVDVDPLRCVRAAARAAWQVLGPDAVLARTGDHDLAALVAGGLPACPAAVLERLGAALAAAGVSAALGAGERSGTETLQQVWWRARSPGAPAAGPATEVDVPGAPGAPRASGMPGASGVPGADGASDEGRAGAVDAVLALVRRQLGADAAFVSAFEEGQRRLRNLVAGVPLPPGIGVGTVEPAVGTHCELLVTGRLDPVVPDVAADPRTRDLPTTRALGIGSYVGVPLHRRDGRLYGTLCAVSHAPDPTLRQRDADVLGAVASAVMDVVEADERAERARTAAVDRLVDLRERGGLRTVAQPVVALADLREVGAEALSRFPDGTPGPAWWFAQASASGMGELLETDAVRGGLALLDEGAGEGRAVLAAPRYVALNCSAATIASGALGRALAGRDLGRVVVEITEHEQVDDYDALRAALAPLRAGGMRVAVDDAGAGFSTMRHVLALVPDLIKLDISLVTGIDTDPARYALAAALTGFARGTGAEIVAEGVETAAELVCLRTLGVSYGQGYLFGPPR